MKNTLDLQEGERKPLKFCHHFSSLASSTTHCHSLLACPLGTNKRCSGWKTITTSAEKNYVGFI